MIGEFELYKQDNHYLSLVKAIIGQQLSIKDAETIFSRFIDLTKRNIIPEKVIMLSDEALRKIGISYQKIKYIKDLSAKVLNKEITLETLDKLSNSEVINTLTSDCRNVLNLFPGQGRCYFYTRCRFTTWSQMVV